MSYENKVSFREGRIVLYTRNGSPTFHVRLKVDGQDGYVVRSTKRVSVEEARTFAEDLYDDLRYRVRNNLDTGTHTFASLWKRWLAANRASLSIHRLRYIEGTANRYLLPFFGKRSLESINDVIVTQYWTWRIAYWSSAEGTAKIEAARKTRATKQNPWIQKLGNVAKVPAQKSLDMERTALLQIFHWGERNGLMKRVPDVSSPKVKPRGVVERRPAFEIEEWKELYRFMRGWVREEYTVTPSASQGSPIVRKPNGFHLWHRELLRSYVLFMGASGLRPNEARQLRWRDIATHTDEQGTKHIVLYVAPTTKTGERETIPLRNAWVIIDRLKAASSFTAPDNLVFCDRSGAPIDNFGKTFKALLIRCNLLKDRFGRDRTIYSLRHTYCTLKLLHSDVKIEDLAQNLGTSPATIFAHYRHITTRMKASSLGGQLRPGLSSKGLYF
ncbi:MULTISPECIES: tyrosine-type recombinase/integrase [unclassified Aureimonas]|uniref:tyrosine-type recombinase/integrase n=1 Tax=unclassified Aureimonas TaxID=2615206 RepID=UPI0006F4F12E|nr:MULTISPECIES: tyrosine-type recombinase/integrase [unclassified Aureimonas]KQT52998.1 hypothetical protein ASG62_13920 [Aureimonas sp. Leaf427]KQT80455.1 hypothetical protein ASG54_07770 [Aureimonas sp. Leaf460]